MNTTAYKGFNISSLNDRFYVDGKGFNPDGYKTLSGAKGAITKAGSGERTTVYRIENKKGEGMYRATGADFGQLINSFSTNRHPCPQEDSKLVEQLEDKNLLSPWGMLRDNASVYSYGFSSVAQLRSWVYRDNWLRWLDEKGFILAVIEVCKDKCMKGSTQCMFIKPAHYEKKSIKEFFNL